MRHYCHLASDGDVDTTNLHLYSLQQAARCWNDLARDRVELLPEWVPYYQERLAFILSCLGLSLTQLLGQNVPSLEKKRMARPGELLTAILAHAAVDEVTKAKFKSTFGDFLSVYDAVRHFGNSGHGEKYRKLEELTIEQLDRFRQMTIEIWDVVIAMYRTDKDSAVDIETISDVVRFVDIDAAATLQTDQLS
jgi:hypothetical protein